MTPFQRQLWLERRSKGIGASDCAAVCGMSPWKTALEIYLEKTKQTEPGPMTKPMEWGLRLEPILAEAYEQETGRTLIAPEPINEHPELPWMLATLDRLTSDEKRNVELKTANAFSAGEWGEPGTDEIPEPYLLQVAHQMAVTGLDISDVAVLIGGSDFRVYTVHRKQSLIDTILEIEADFWAMVQRREPPTIDWKHASTPGLVAKMFGVNEGESVDLGPEEEDMRVRYERLKEEMGDMEKECEIIRTRILFAMKEASAGRFPSGFLASRTQVSVKEYTVPAKSYTRLTFRKPKKAKVGA